MMLIKQVSTPSLKSVTFDLCANETDSETRIDKVLEQLHAKSLQADGESDAKKGDYRCIIDTTGYLEKTDTKAYASAMLRRAYAATKDDSTRPTIKLVAYYEVDELKTIDMKGSVREYDKFHTDRDEIIALWDVSHTTGSDIRVSKVAHATIVVGKHLKLYEFAQAAFRLRDLGPKGQRLQVFVPQNDRDVMVKKMMTWLGDDIGVAKGEDLTVDQVIQYALLNELLQETDNNYRAVDMRMKSALMGPVLELLWDPKVKADDAAEMYNIIRELFIKTTPIEPWELLKGIVIKEKQKKALEITKENWLKSSILANIASREKLFTATGADGVRVVDVSAIKREFREILDGDLGPLQDEVDSSSLVGRRQTVEVKAKQQVQIKQEVKISVHVETRSVSRKQEEVYIRPTFLQSLRRNPFPPRPTLPIHRNLFMSAAHAFIPFAKATRLHAAELSKDALEEKPKFGGGIAATELLALDPKLAGIASCIDTSKISFSLNLAPIWRAPASAPLFVPYGYFSQRSTTLLIIQSKEHEDDIRLKLIDRQEAEQIASMLAEDRLHPERAPQHEVRLGLYEMNWYNNSAQSIVGAGKKSLREQVTGRIFSEGSERLPAGLVGTTKMADKQLRSNLVAAKLLAQVMQFAGEGERKTVEQMLRYPGAMCDVPQFVDSIIHMLRMSNRTMAMLNGSTVGSELQTEHVAPMFAANNLSEMASGAHTPTTSSSQPVQRLLFDRSVDLSGRVALAIEEGVGLTASENYVDWSTSVVPMLPILEGFEVLGANGALDKRTGESGSKGLGSKLDGSTDGVKTVKTAVPLRRWAMHYFFPALSDEYAAWKTAVPAMVIRSAFKVGKGELDKVAPSTGGPTANYLRLALESRPSTVATIGNIDQLEMMAELAHPIWGLPHLSANTSAELVKKIEGWKSDPLHKYTVDDLMPAQKSKNGVINAMKGFFGSDEFGGVKYAIEFALAACEAVDLPRSLHSIDATQAGAAGYPFERLHGLFSFLASQHAQSEAVTTFGLYMLPRVYSGELGDETLFYSRYIPESATPAAETILPWRVRQMLDDSFANVKANHKMSTSSLATKKETVVFNPDNKIPWWDASLVIRKFTSTNGYAGDTGIAKAVAAWLSDELQTAAEQHWFLDGLAFQLFGRADRDATPTVNHTQFRKYVSELSGKTEAQRKEMLADMRKKAKYNTFTDTELDVLFDRWHTMDFDLTVEVLNISTLEKPHLSVAQVSSMFAEVLNALNPAKHTFKEAAERELFTRIVEQNLVGKPLAPPFNEETQSALKKLVKISDSITSHSDWVKFKTLQVTLAPLRLAGWHVCKCNACPSHDKCEADASARQQEVLKWLPKVFGSAMSHLQKVVYTLFVPPQLMAAPHQVTADEIKTVLSGMFDAADYSNSVEGSTAARFYKGTDKSKWTTHPDWWELSMLAAPFTFTGSQVQSAATFAWLNAELGRRTSKTNWMLDGLILQALTSNVQEVKNDGLVLYSDQRTDEADDYTATTFLKEVVKTTKVSRWTTIDQYVNPILVALTASNKKWKSKNNLGLFVELADTQTQDRTLLRSESLASELAWLLREPVAESAKAIETLLNEALFKYGLDTVVHRATSKTKRPPLTDLIRAAESVLEQSSNPLHYATIIEGINALRLVSDFTATSASAKENLVEAITELISPSTVRCAFSDRNLHSRMPLDPTHVRLKRTRV
jgi:hypothetical protein